MGIFIGQVIGILIVIATILAVIGMICLVRGIDFDKPVEIKTTISFSSQEEDCAKDNNKKES